MSRVMWGECFPQVSVHVMRLFSAFFCDLESVLSFPCNYNRDTHVKNLFVIDRHERVAAYGLFLYDPKTAVGLVEPMRTEVDYQRRGLAGHILSAGFVPDKHTAVLSRERLPGADEMEND